MLKRLGKSLPIVVALMAIGTGPAFADTSGKYDISEGNNSESYGNYVVNQRAGDTRVWLKDGTLHKNYVAGCDWVQVGGIKMAQLCNAMGYKDVNGYVTIGILTFSTYIKVCHKYDGSTTCASKKLSW